MKYREYLRNRLGNTIPSDIPLPRKFHVVGHVALLHLDSKLVKYAHEIGDATLEFNKRVKSVAVKMGPTLGITRQPSYSLVAGKKETVTTHIENGVKFRLDPLRLTFSGGNRKERSRIPKLVRSGENIVDMFSCVGQFGLHIAATANVKVTAIEINPIAFGFLVENIKLNELDNRVTAILGDCREVHPEGVANRVIMGYLHDTVSYLPAAIKTLVDEGGVIHMHLSIPESEKKQTVERIDEICRGHGFHSATDVFKVKNYSPGIEHFVFDIHTKRNKA
ncbi:MAG: class I SAM-dependent methyltransferase family protein [Candidatus Thorarchaeota archaeon]